MEPRKFCPLSAPGTREVMCNAACAWYDVSTQGCIMQGIARSREAPDAKDFHRLLQ